MSIPTLSSPRLTLRPLDKATQRNVSWLRDPKVVAFSEQRHREHTLATCLRGIKSYDYTWGIWLAGDDQHIGNLTASLDPPNQTADLGIMIGEREAWGHGYGPEAWKTVSDWLLDKECGGLRKLEAGCMKPNVQMIKVFEKCGFQFECERPAHFIYLTSPVGAVYYGRYR